MIGPLFELRKQRSTYFAHPAPDYALRDGADGVWFRPALPMLPLGRRKEYFGPPKLAG